MKRIFISAGDPSGDLHASRLMKEIKNLTPEVEFIGFGGRNMEKEGLESIIPLEKISIVGFWEVAKKYFFFLKFLKKCQKIISSGEVDLYLPVDFPGFNLRLSETAKSQNVPVVYYIAPQLWAWGKNRAKTLKNKVDELLTVFPFETDFFENYGIKTHFVGHPLLDDPEIPDEIPEKSDRDDVIAVLPGSRTQEVKRILPAVAKAIPRIKKKFPDHRIAIAKASFVEEDIYEDILNDKNFEIWENTRDLLRTAKTGIVKTGTSNLEAALCGMPFVMVYLTSLGSYYLGRNLVNLPYISIVNILTNKELVKELIQNDVHEELIYTHIDSLLCNEMKYDFIQSQFQSIRELLGEKGAARNAAERVVKHLS